MARWTLLRNDRRSRAEWVAGLVWFLLRYAAPEGPLRGLALLSRHTVVSWTYRTHGAVDPNRMAEGPLRVPT